MATEQTEDNKSKDNNKDAAVKPDSETLHSTDPQEHMEGPLSSLMHKTAKTMDTKETAEEADKKDD